MPLFKIPSCSMSYTCTRYCPGDKCKGRVEERVLFLSTGRSIDLLKSTVSESVMNVKLKSVPKAALQSGVYFTDALTVPPSLAVTTTLSMPWVPTDKSV